MININYKVLLNLLLIFIFIVNPIFADTPGEEIPGEEPGSTDSGLFSGIWDGAKDWMKQPTEGIINLYSENVKTFQSIVNPWEDTNNDGKNPYAEKIGPLFYYTFSLIYYLLLIWLDFIVFLALFSTTSEENYFKHKTRVKAFMRTCGAVMISGVYSSIIITFMMAAIRLFSATGLDVVPGNIEWYDMFGGLIIGTILYVLSFALLTIGYIAAIFIGFGYVAIAVTYVMKKSTGPLQTIGSYLFFMVIWMMAIPIVFAAPGFFISFMFGAPGDGGVMSQLTRALVSLILGIVATFMYIKLGGKMFFMMRLKKMMGTFSGLGRATKESAKQTMALSKKVALAGAGGIAASAHYAANPGQALGDAKGAINNRMSSVGSSVGSSFNNLKSRIGEKANVIGTNYNSGNFMNLTDTKAAKATVNNQIKAAYSDIDNQNALSSSIYGVSQISSSGSSPGKRLSQLSNNPLVDKSFMHKLAKSTGYKK